MIPLVRCTHRAPKRTDGIKADYQNEPALEGIKQSLPTAEAAESDLGNTSVENVRLREIDAQTLTGSLVSPTRTAPLNRVEPRLRMTHHHNRTELPPLSRPRQHFSAAV